MYHSPCRDMLDAATDGQRLSSRPQPRGEGDTLRAVSRRRRRQLIGARYLTPGGAPADVLCAIANARLGRDMTTCDFVAWYVDLAARAVIEDRAAARRRRMAALCRRAGVTSEYAWRSQLARAEGYRSVHHLAVDRGWR